MHAICLGPRENVWMTKEVDAKAASFVRAELAEACSLLLQ
jgi:hypothetical protein